MTLPLGRTVPVVQPLTSELRAGEQDLTRTMAVSMPWNGPQTRSRSGSSLEGPFLRISRHQPPMALTRLDGDCPPPSSTALAVTSMPTSKITESCSIPHSAVTLVMLPGATGVPQSHRKANAPFSWVAIQLSLRIHSGTSTTFVFINPNRSKPRQPPQAPPRARRDWPQRPLQARQQEEARALARSPPLLRLVYRYPPIPRA